jgi:hypothetical protein
MKLGNGCTRGVDAARMPLPLVREVPFSEALL